LRGILGRIILIASMETAWDSSVSLRGHLEQHTDRDIEIRKITSADCEKESDISATFQTHGDRGGSTGIAPVESKTHRTSCPTHQ